MTVARPLLPALTSARFLAALLVVLFHYDVPNNDALLGFSNFGYEAVAFFFLLSGFILTYAHGSDDGLNVSLRQFIAARVGRICPAYYIALLLAAPFFFHSIRHGANTLCSGALVITMMQAWWPSAAMSWNGAAWSLSNEAAFYALFPLVWIAARRLSARSLLIGSYCAVICISALRRYLPYDFGAYFPLFNLPQFTLGVALGGLYLAGFPLDRRLAAGAAIGLLFIIALKNTHPWLSDVAITAPVFSALILGLTTLGSNPILASTPLLVLGQASYSIYILHVPILYWWGQMSPLRLGFHLATWLDFSIYLAIVMTASIAVSTLIERPVRNAMRANPPKIGNDVAAGPVKRDAGMFQATCGDARHAEPFGYQPLGGES